MIRYLSTLVLALAAALLMSQARAEKVVIYREGQLVNPQEVAQVLGKTRGIQLLDGGATGGSARSATAAALPARAPGAAASEKANAEAAALSLPVRFAFASAEILPAARDQLDALAKGIKLLPSDSAVTIEGHTDAVGDGAYNLALSRARAQSVRDYLVQQHGIDAARLKTVGFGKEQPIEGSDPCAALNRRVQFRGS
ncbi:MULTISPECIES: OmpA family protein [Ramlibacter]|uniref:OmpA family protein n=1 Tax=Ramlibacter pinisoli TaxID=2682844 RepID=A0A6N8IYG8_9BURK|nr:MULTISPECIES: OmpA family protein [Ramlibacter]MBA2962081.1 OmpA family protein [Ramlibacter sp. CGMCC 1.13660]MVQ32024.1 OmpA family protein [Ramlibacter pinisoli]